MAGQEADYDVYDITERVTPVIAESPHLHGTSWPGFTNGKSFFVTDAQVSQMSELLSGGQLRRRAGGGWEEVIPGKGLRYLAVHSQEDGVRINRERVFYTFQGLSHDGRFYVTVQVPYAPASLPTRAELDRTKNYDVAPYPAESRGKGPAYDAYRQKVDAYRADLTRKLNAEEGKADLRALDALVRSIRLR